LASILAVIPLLADNSKLPVIWWTISLSEPEPNIKASDDADMVISNKVIDSATPKEPQIIRSLFTYPSCTIWKGCPTDPPLTAIVALAAVPSKVPCK
tara:strand:- start:609 stop:899 length:291 start_codon:yes stop_codon:yes gene_type:complete